MQFRFYVLGYLLYWGMFFVSKLDLGDSRCFESGSQYILFIRNVTYFCNALDIIEKAIDTGISVMNRFSDE